MFTDHALRQELTTTGTYNGLYNALLASRPPLSVRSHDEQDGGLVFFEQSPRIRNTPIRGSITFHADTGTIVIAADGYSGPRWLTALDRLTTPTTAWSWQPATDHKPGTLQGTLRLGPGVTAETCYGASSHHGAADAVLGLIPADHDHCEPAWALAVAVLGVLVTDNPGYHSPVLPAPDLTTFTGPSTDYEAAIATSMNALALLDENGDFDTARDTDPSWPVEAEGAAVRALRDFRDALIKAIPLQHPVQPDSAAQRGEPGGNLHETQA
ncbi:hypothetical protein ACFY91_24565 [Streptomyces albogriseolus]|uniref:hypothetical protein n=1 Tax=Streptomyces albogriseolus TaxID=1887 RepID=UPI0036E12D7B